METLGRTFAMDTACFFFALGTLLCALSTNIWMLIGARAIAGVCPLSYFAFGNEELN
jgi:predicted MFS family arabinose efflux permease